MTRDIPDDFTAVLPPTWIITINNQSSQSQNYAIFSEVPLIDSSTKPDKVYNNVIAVADNVSAHSGLGVFEIRKQLQATCGRLVLSGGDNSTLFSENSSNPPDVVSIVEVVDRCSITLGKTLPDGTDSPGTKCVVQVANNETPTFKTPSLTGGKAGAFAVQTGNDFTSQDAKSMHYFVGFGSSMNKDVGPFAMFVPAPVQTYQITPQAKFKILVADLLPKAVLTDAQKAAAALEIDFAKLGVDAVVVVHDDNNNLTIQKPGPDLG
ncbi:hypothetical protein AYO21_11979 [Fonsecaea monophora]|uniref:Uncharacterized protein n=1 Tax=Fonsecaea monophora TaxID=254056 RepID=A0A177EPQ5_9EURO|nr:hypothetical protein AYO21_11979 [Fonsecaea monophora]OAG33907.1 hypothetical protein AYO21_11979 [Fonsecaea monophora]